METIWDAFSNPVAVIVGVGAICFAIHAGRELAEMTVASLRQELRPEKPKPKPREYRVFVEDEDGWPMRSYTLSGQAVGRLMRELDRRPPA